MRWKVVVSYDGSFYRGWQKQHNAQSVQECIEQALATIHKASVEIVASGRTDADVHAFGQVFHFDSDKTLDGEHWKQAINRLLPHAIRIQNVTQTSEDFHARFYATSKRYDYLITKEVDNPFIQRYKHCEKYPLDVTYMRECANVFLGTHDFTSFTSAKIDPLKPRIKTITRLDVLEEGNDIRLIFEGNGFLRYMVRMITQTLIEAGKKRITKETIQSMLESKDKHACRYKAPGCGLYLMHVSYGGEDHESELSYSYNSLPPCSGK